MSVADKFNTELNPENYFLTSAYNTKNGTHFLTTLAQNKNTKLDEPFPVYLALNNEDDLYIKTFWLELDAAGDCIHEFDLNAR